MTDVSLEKLTLLHFHRACVQLVVGRGVNPESVLYLFREEGVEPLYENATVLESGGASYFVTYEHGADDLLLSAAWGESGRRVPHDSYRHDELRYQLRQAQGAEAEPCG